MSRSKEQVNIRLSEEARGYLYALQRHYGLSQAGVLEMLLREAGRQREVSPRQGMVYHQKGG